MEQLLQQIEDHKKEIEIYNMLGEKIYVEYLAADIKRTTISVTNFLPGIYFIKIRGEKGDLVAKFVKQ